MQTTTKRALRTALGASCLFLAAHGIAAQEQERDFDAELTKLEEQYEQAQKEWMEAYRAAKTDEERGAIIDDQPGEEFVELFKELADDAAGTEAAGGAWMWVLRTARGGHQDTSKLAVEILANDYIDSKSIAELPSMLRYGGGLYGEELCANSLRTLATESAEPTVQAPALYNLAAYLLDQPEATDEHRADATALLNELKEQHAELKDQRGRTYAALAEGLLQSMNIRVGEPAPEIVGKDLDGVEFKLSDYKGKVVLLDFWGHW